MRILRHIFKSYKRFVKSGWGFNMVASAPVGWILTYFWGASVYFKTFLMIYTFIGVFSFLFEIAIDMLDEINEEERKKEINYILGGKV